MRLKSLAALAAALGLLLAGNVAAPAQDYPNRPVKIVIAFSPSGAIDVLGRFIAQHLSEMWGQQIVVENRPGGSGNIGAAAASTAPADGYTLHFGAQTLAVNVTLSPTAAFDPVTSFEPIMLVATSLEIFMVANETPYKSLKEVIDYAKANPGKPYGTFGNATTSHLYGELLKKVADVDMTHVPYRGSAPLTNDLLANTVTTAFQDLTTASAQIKAGKLRALAVGGEKRRTALPDVPTMGELGYPGFEIEGWLGVFVPAATPKEIVKKLSDELARIIASPEGVAGIETLSLVPVGGSAEAFEKVLRRDYEKWADVVKATGVKGE